MFPKFTSIVRAVLLASCVFAVSCSNRIPRTSNYVVPTPMPVSTPTYQYVSEVKFEGQNIDINSMHIANETLYVSGSYIGFGIWDIGQNREAPVSLFAQREHFNDFSPPVYGAWVYSWYGRNAMAHYGGYLITSGDLGASVLNVSATSAAQEVVRYPASDKATNYYPRDIAYMYNAMVVHPTLPLLYGFTKDDSVIVSNLSGSQIQPTKKFPYAASGTKCCVMGAAYFNGSLFVAFGNELWKITMSSDGNFTGVEVVAGLQATNVVATNRYLYVQHSPAYSATGGSALPAGIYVLDQNLQQVTSFNIQPRTFAVSGNDTHLYGNMDGLAVRIYRLLFTN